MIHPWQEKTENQIDNRFVFPRYDGLSFANIPGTILNFFGLTSPNPPLNSGILTKIPRTQKLILILIDGLGFLWWEKFYKDYPLLEKVSAKGEVFPLTSVFPSTTPAAITTINSGLLPSEHGLLEWFLYFEEIDQIVETLPFMPIGEKTPDILAKRGVNPKILFNGKTIYEKLSKKGIKSFVFLNKDYADSSYNKVAFKKANIVPFGDLNDLFKNFLYIFKEEHKPSYFYIYWGSLDSASHQFGPCSKESKKELKIFSDNAMKLLGKAKNLLGDATLLITADHGQIDINSKDTILLNTLPGFERNLGLSKNGQRILPSGNARDVFLQIKDEKLDHTQKFLQKKLNNKAKVIKKADLLKFGIFGRKKPSKRFHQRIGNLLILPTSNNTVFYEYTPKHPSFLGHHGGLSKEEMLIPFGIIKPS